VLAVDAGRPQVGFGRIRPPLAQRLPPAATEDPHATRPADKNRTP